MKEVLSISLDALWPFYWYVLYITLFLAISKTCVDIVNLFSAAFPSPHAAWDGGMFWISTLCKIHEKVVLAHGRKFCSRHVNVKLLGALLVRQLMHKNGLFVHLYIELFWCFFLKDVSLRNHFQEGAQKFKPGNSQIRTLLRRTYTSKYAKNEIF